MAKDRNMPDRQHIHCVVRTLNGNDYGKDLLRHHDLARTRTPDFSLANSESEHQGKPRRSANPLFAGFGDWQRAC